MSLLKKSNSIRRRYAEENIRRAADELYKKYIKEIDLINQERAKNDLALIDKPDPGAPSRIAKRINNTNLTYKKRRAFAGNPPAAEITMPAGKARSVLCEDPLVEDP